MDVSATLSAGTLPPVSILPWDLGASEPDRLDFEEEEQAGSAVIAKARASEVKKHLVGVAVIAMVASLKIERLCGLGTIARENPYRAFGVKLEAYFGRMFFVLETAGWGYF
jgi:hypothetical protein